MFTYFKDFKYFLFQTVKYYGMNNTETKIEHAFVFYLKIISTFLKHMKSLEANFGETQNGISILVVVQNFVLINNTTALPTKI